MKYFLLRLGHKAQSEIISGKKGVGRTPQRPHHSTGRDHYWSLDRVKTEGPIFIELISDGNKSDFLMFLNSVTGKQSQYYLQSGQQTLLIMICAAGAALPTALLLHQVLDKSPINFFRTQIKIFKVSVTGSQFSK